MASSEREREFTYAKNLLCSALPFFSLKRKAKTVEDIRNHDDRPNSSFYSIRQDALIYENCGYLQTTLYPKERLKDFNVIGISMKLMPK